MSKFKSRKPEVTVSISIVGPDKMFLSSTWLGHIRNITFYQKLQKDDLTVSCKNKMCTITISHKFGVILTRCRSCVACDLFLHSWSFLSVKADQSQCQDCNTIHRHKYLSSLQSKCLHYADNTSLRVLIWV